MTYLIYIKLLVPTILIRYSITFDRLSFQTYFILQFTIGCSIINHYLVAFNDDGILYNHL